jgi:hypothetical protein
MNLTNLTNEDDEDGVIILFIVKITNCKWFTLLISFKYKIVVYLFR